MMMRSPVLLAASLATAPSGLLLPSMTRAAAVRLIAEPSAWTEWNLRDVGLFDGTALALLTSSTFLLSSGRRSVGDGDGSGAPPVPPLSKGDPNELPSVFELLKSSHRGSVRGGESPRMMAAPSEALPDIVIGDIDDTDDERLWVPQTDCLSFRPLCLCVSQGYYVNLLRFVGGGVLGCHRHSSPVHAHTIKGTWGYKEHDWQAQPGTYVFEPPGETHTLLVGPDEMITLFHVTGALLYCDPDDHGTVIGFDDVFTKLEKARAHYERVGLGADYVEQFIR
jgi:2,4'-dihydroxyacetophenone dioxygenase